jgi:phosphohistidine phosphatase
MELILFRHGIAADVDPATGDDAARPLTDEGIARTQQAAAGLARIIEKPSLLLTSPKVRAAQTADLLARVLRFDPTNVQTLATLATGPASAILESLTPHATAERLIIVGHEPLLSETIALLCAGHTNRPVVEMKKAGAASITTAPGLDGALTFGTLNWLLPPKMLRQLAM